MMTHGTRYTYNRGCRCVPCTQAATDYTRQHRAHLRASPVPDDLHGAAATYRNRGCRCDACRAAHNTKTREDRNNRR